MIVNYNDLKKNPLYYRGKVNSSFYFNGTTIFKLDNGDYFRQIDTSTLPVSTFFPNIEIYNLSGKFGLIYLSSNFFVNVEKIKVIETKMTQQFTGFEQNKTYEFENGQIWQQIDPLNAPNHISSGYVKIINDKIMIVDTWTFHVNVILINNKKI